MEKQSIGYVKLEGKLVENGILDARKTAEALLGVDDLLRSTIIRKVPEFENIEFDLPVYVEGGSIIIQIPENIGELITLGVIKFGLGSLAYVWAKSYLTEAGKLMAKNDFKEEGLTTVIRGVISLIQDVIKLGKHTKTLGTKEFPDAKIQLPSNMVGIPSPEGEIEFFHRSVLDEFSKFSVKQFTKLGELVQVERELIIGLKDDSRQIEERITQKEKYIFIPEPEESNSVIFPELTHELPVSLEGESTRGTLTTNSIGFRYNGHILNCHPREGNIIKFKNALFTRCLLQGTIDRTDEFGGTQAKKPKIILDSLTPLIEPMPTESNLPFTQE
ncbi:MAG: hypothetical protein U0P81_02745 [Holophagaceae bacterium]